MDKYWKNQSGYYDPTPASVIEMESANELKRQRARNKEVHDTIQEIKNLLDKKDLELLGRVAIKDRISGKEYR